MYIAITPTLNCNLRCIYCYVDNKLKQNDLISIELAKHLIDEIFYFAKYKNIKNITISWHGGEPLLWGYKNFNTIFEYIELLRSRFFNLKQEIQTNLTLINDDFIGLFKKFNIKVGFSLDGPENINDVQRVFSYNKGSYSQIIEKLNLCQNANLKIGAIVTGTSKNIKNIKELYDFMNEKGIDFRFNPIFKEGQARTIYPDFGISTEEYGNAMIELFNIWVNDKKSKINIDFFSEIAGNLVTKRPYICCFQQDCQKNYFAISSNGDIYPCGRFIGNEFLNFGNISNQNLIEIIDTKDKFFANRRLEFLKKECSDCKYFDICNGGCMHEAFSATNNFENKTYLCEAYKRIFMYIEKYLEYTM
ncbi:MAG: hypothetical protein A2033_05240 [Bacteroidetes bacterium GWA2_31_9]|nr:MAG: hypothetical protein A2033_05240 [Bacteroidetes bacterium GWA2_31_9]